MIYLIYGQDTFRSLQKILAFKAKYTKALGDINLITLEAKDNTFENIWQNISALPFLSSKRLIILKNLLIEGSDVLQDQFLKYIDNVPDSSILLLYEQGLPEAKNKLFLKLQKKTTCKNFPLLKDFNLKSWVKERAQDLHLKLSPSASDKLILFVGNDLWRMSQELLKLKNYNEQKIVEAEIVELLVRPKIESDIFNLTDAIGQNNFPKAISALEKLFLTGEPEVYILKMIAWQFKNILILKDLIDKYHDHRSIARSGLHPFVAQKAAGQATNFSFNKLKKIYQIILNYDLKIKIGKIEAREALEILIAQLILLGSKEGNWTGNQILPVK